MGLRRPFTDVSVPEPLMVGVVETAKDPDFTGDDTGSSVARPDVSPSLSSALSGSKEPVALIMFSPPVASSAVETISRPSHSYQVFLALIISFSEASCGSRLRRLDSAPQK